MKILVPKLGYMPKGCHGNPQIRQVIINAIGSCLQTDSKNPLLKTAPTQLMNMGGQADSYTEPLPSNVFDKGTYALCWLAKQSPNQP